MALFSRKFRRSTTRRTFTGVALVAFFVSTVGLPLPALPSKDSGVPFPCQNHPCGCRSAEECWRHCCCFTPAQRWAWARANHVEPPSYAERPASEDAEHSPCCAHHGHPTGHTEPTKANCCAAAGHDSSCCKTESCPQNHQPTRSQTGIRWMLVVASQGCQGVTSQWLGTGAAVPPPPVLTWSPAWPLVDKLCYSDLSPSLIAPIPPDPPPRFLS